MAFAASSALAQAPVTIQVEDVTGAGLPGAFGLLRCAGAGERRLPADEAGLIKLDGGTANCSLTVSAPGFARKRYQTIPTETGVEVRLTPASDTEVTVSADIAPLVNETSTAQETLSAKQLAAVPVFNASTGFTDILTRTTPGVAADANGFAHPLGEHADTSLSLDGQPITDQLAKVFSNQPNPNIIASLTATTGAPPAAFGGKTSLTIDLTTKSGLRRKPFGTFGSSYGSFGTSSHDLAMGVGSKRWGEFLALNVNASGRFLDTPEFRPLHDHGNGESAFNRLDWQPNASDFFHLNLGGGRSWFQTPNSYDTAAAGQDQRSQIRSVNAAIGWNHVFSPSLLTVFTPFYRHDEAQYVPSANPLADSTATLAQNRTLTNTGFRLEGTYAKGPHVARVGGTYWHTLLHERFDVGLTDPLFNAVCVDNAGDPTEAPGIQAPARCAGAGYAANPDFLPNLLPYDLSRGGTLFHFNGSADVVEAAFYGQDDITIGPWHLSPGLRYSIYNGLSHGRQLEPRFGISRRIPFAHTVLRASYAHLYETPYNENLIFANESAGSTTGANPFASYRSEPVRPGTRNQFNTGFEQPFGKHLSVDADYYWKYTHNDFDFDTLFNTPITFSVAWRKSKIDGFAITANLRDWHGVTVSSVMGHVRTRFFTPEVGGLIFNSVPSSPVFRIDHGEEFEHTTDIRYELSPDHVHGHRLFVGGTWRYSSGLALPDTVPTYLDALQLTADQQAQMGLHCGSLYATPSTPVRTCTASAFGADRVRIPAFGTEDDDRHPVRVAPRTLFDVSLGDERMFRFEGITVGLHAGMLNALNKVALYDFLSTFSGTHFVPPRSLQVSTHFSF